jgi:hypothetical protein
VSKYADHASRAALPIWVGEIPPTVWAQSWADRPRDVVTLGMRSLSEEALSQVSSMASARASRFQPNASPDSDLWIGEYNRALVCLTVGRALCTADSADVPFWDYPDLVSPTALDPKGALWLWGLLSVELTRASAIVPVEPPLDLLTKLIHKLQDIEALPIAKRNQVCKFLAAALEVTEDV